MGELGSIQMELLKQSLEAKEDTIRRLPGAKDCCLNAELQTRDVRSKALGHYLDDGVTQKPHCVGAAEQSLVRLTCPPGNPQGEDVQRLQLRGSKTSAFGESAPHA